MGHAFRLIAVGALAAIAARAASVTVVLQFESAPSRQVVAEMEREAQRLVAGEGLELQWRLRTDVSSADVFEQVVVVNFTGRCAVPSAVRPLSPAPEVLGVTHSSGDTLIPFSEVKCDAVGALIAQPVKGQTPSAGDAVYGRALGRVLAHELRHAARSTRTHEHHGYARASLSAAQLIAERF
jgi:hypothetical protein